MQIIFAVRRKKKFVLHKFSGCNFSALKIGVETINKIISHTIKKLNCMEIIKRRKTFQFSKNIQKKSLQFTKILRHKNKSLEPPFKVETMLKNSG